MLKIIKLIILILVVTLLLGTFLYWQGVNQPFDKDGNDIGGSVNTLTSERWTPFAFGNAQHTIMAEVTGI